MRTIRVIALWLLLATVAPLTALAQNDLEFADLGTCELEKGAVIEDCRLGYRTFGRLNAQRTNAILAPTYFTGRSEDLMEYLGPEGMIDTTKYFVILVDAFGNGVSSSPSNSDHSPGWEFPEFTVLDMVRAEHRLATEHLDLPQLYAVVGTSMGGMQALQWAVSYPDFVEKVVSIAGTPRLTAYDVLLWVTELEAIEVAGLDPELQRLAMETVARIHALALETPERVSERDEDEFEDRMENRIDRTIRHDPLDWASQLRAMLYHDIYRPFDRFEDVADVIEADMLLVVNEQDHMVNPEPSRRFAEITGARLLDYDVACGHLIMSCVEDELEAEVRAFLADG